MIRQLEHLQKLSKRTNKQISMENKKYITPSVKIVKLASEDVCLGVYSDPTTNPTMNGREVDICDDWDEE